MKNRSTRSRRSRVVLLSVLAVVALLLIAGMSIVTGWRDGENPPASAGGQRAGGAETLASEVDAVCRAFGIPAKAVRARPVKDRQGKVLRTEYRVRAPRDLSAAEFNADLSVRMEPFGARVVGTERTRDRTVTLHVIRDEETVLSVILDLNEPPSSGKDHGH